MRLKFLNILKYNLLNELNKRNWPKAQSMETLILHFQVYGLGTFSESEEDKHQIFIHKASGYARIDSTSL